MPLAEELHPKRLRDLVPLLQAMVAKIEAVRPDLFGLKNALPLTSPGSLSAPGVSSTATRVIRPIRPPHIRDM